MTHNVSSRFELRERRWIQFLLTWTAGLCCGGILACQASEPYFLLMRRAANGPVSIIGLLAAVGLPFLAVLFCVYISRPKLIYWICFIKACSFTTTGFGTMAAFGSAGWLVRFLLQFTDTLSLPALCWFALRHLDGDKEGLWADAAVCCISLICLGWIDLSYVSPFLAALTEITQTGR